MIFSSNMYILLLHITSTKLSYHITNADTAHGIQSLANLIGKIIKLIGVVLSSYFLI